MVMLYGATLQTPIKILPETTLRSYSTAWTWLAAMLNLEPQPISSAAVVQAFAQISSFTLLQVFGRQYFKIIKYIGTVYLPKIKEITTKEMKRQTLVQLELYIDECSKKIFERGSLERPDGFVNCLV